MVTEPDVDLEIEIENLHAAQVMYFACMLEESRLFQVVDRIVELFRVGLLPMGARPAAGRAAVGIRRARPMKN
jgi:hypothetical protein